MKQIGEDPRNPLNSLMFGLGQQLKVYWQNGNFNQSRFEGFDLDFLYKMHMWWLVPHLLWKIVQMYTNEGEYMNYFYFWTA